MAEVSKASAAEFKQTVQDNDLVLVDFYADWCGPCRALGPVLDEVADKYDDVRIVKINVDENSELAKEYKVRSIPQMFLIKGGENVESMVGMQTAVALSERIDKHIS
ncbi:MAG: thioredoxin [bacterium]|nr:thioredoxin [bacterium]